MSFLFSPFSSPQDPSGYSWSTSSLYCSVMTFGSPALHCRVNLDELPLPVLSASLWTATLCNFYLYVVHILLLPWSHKKTKSQQKAHCSYSQLINGEVCRVMQLQICPNVPDYTGQMTVLQRVFLWNENGFLNHFAWPWHTSWMKFLRRPFEKHSNVQS